MIDIETMDPRSVIVHAKQRLPKELVRNIYNKIYNEVMSNKPDLTSAQHIADIQLAFAKELLKELIG